MRLDIGISMVLLKPATNLRAVLLAYGLCCLLMALAAHGQQKCTAQGGSCLNSNSAACPASSHVWLTGLCPGAANIKCCAPTPKCAAAGGQCLNTNSQTCSGNLLTGLCPGPANVKCCVSSSKCTQTSGVCINTQTQKCPGTLMTGLCPGAANIKCCAATPKCTAAGGQCLDTNSQTCSGTLKTGLCPGPANIRCCTRSPGPPPPPPASTVLGLDVSAYQSAVNWDTVRADGAAFAFVKATEGTTYTSPKFAQQYDGSVRAGLLRGAYHFALPHKTGGAAQADFFINHGGGWQKDGRTLPGALDIEYNPYKQSNGLNDCYGLSPAAMREWIVAFVNRYHARTSRWPVVYSTADWWNRCTGKFTGLAADCPLWVARYASSVGTLPAGWSGYAFWQTADHGTFPGDQNVWHGTLAQLREFACGGACGTAAPHGHVLRTMASADWSDASCSSSVPCQHDGVCLNVSETYAICDCTGTAGAVLDSEVSPVQWTGSLCELAAAADDSQDIVVNPADTLADNEDSSSTGGQAAGDVARAGQSNMAGGAV